MTKPQHFLPVHGEYAFLCAHAQLAREVPPSRTVPVYCCRTECGHFCSCFLPVPLRTTAAQPTEHLALLLHDLAVLQVRSRASDPGARLCKENMPEQACHYLHIWASSRAVCDSLGQ